PAAGTADWIMRTIERAAPPSGGQRAGLEAMRLRSAAMAQLIAASCPGDAQLRGGHGSPRPPAVCSDEHEPDAAAALRLARRQAEGRAEPGAEPSQAFGRCRRALLRAAA